MHVAVTKLGFLVMEVLQFYSCAHLDLPEGSGNTVRASTLRTCTCLRTINREVSPVVYAVCQLSTY